MKKITLYRIEHYKSNIGPYQHSKNDNWRKRSHDHLPTPLRESLVSNMTQLKKNYKCAFISKISLKKWLNKSEIIRLQKRGFHICKFQIMNKGIKKGKNQILFPLKKKRYNVKQITISELYE